VIDAAPCEGSTPAEDSDDWDVVGRVSPSGGSVTLHGRDFGDTGGEVWARAAEVATASVQLSVVGWHDTQIELSIGNGQLAMGQWFLEVRPAGDSRRWSVGRFILRVGDGQCLPGSLPGSWTVRRLDLPSDRYNFFLLDDGAVMLPFVGGLTWVKVGTWSVAGNTLTVERCAQPNFQSFGFTGTWSADAAADGFGVRSCPPSYQGPCPAARGAYTYYFTDGTPLAPWQVDSEGGFVSAQQYTNLYGEGWMTCHGGCGAYWATAWAGPGACAQRP
jgi:hypothetical protein